MLPKTAQTSDRLREQFTIGVNEYELSTGEAMRLMDHEYNGHQLRAVCSAISDGIEPEDLDKICDSRFTARQITALAKISSIGADIEPFADPSISAPRMETVFKVLLHGGEGLPLEKLDLDQLRVLNNTLLSHRVKLEDIQQFAKPEIDAENMQVVADALQGANFETGSGDHSLIEPQVRLILNPEYSAEQQLCLLEAMRGQTLTANIPETYFKKFFSPDKPVSEFKKVIDQIEKRDSVSGKGARNDNASQKLNARSAFDAVLARGREHVPSF